MHLNQIASFLAVSKTLNFTGAARQLGIPQSTISRQIGDLESQLGVRLFYRTKRDVQLTDEGRIFLPYAQEISDAARKGTYAVKQIHEGLAGRLSIAVADACRGDLTQILTAFHQKYPDISVDITRISSGESLMDDTDSPFDFWFIYRDMLLDPESYGSIQISRVPLALVRSAAGRSGKQDLSAEKFILLSEQADPIIYMQAMNYCRTHRFTPQIANTFDDVSSVVLSVTAGLGVSFLPASLLAGSRKSELDVSPLDDESYEISCIAAWKPSLLNPAASLFLETLKETVRE
ncbi:MAG: LysR family transcriptional regulator [Bacillota bacterium]|nr:LysR family transcriptional regulator [Bacillota bacterium]